MSENFMIGTKFYRNIKGFDTPDIIRLTKQEGDTLYFIDGGYETYLTKDELDKQIETGLMLNTSFNKYIKRFEYFNRWIDQTWEFIGKKDDIYLKFKVQSVGLMMNIKELKRSYIRLIPDGFLTISNIDYPINHGKDRSFDVLITVHKGNDKVPSIVCRQDINDIFNQKNSLYTFIGCCVSKYTCPKGADIRSFMYSENVKNFKATAIYIDDSINSIMKYIGSRNKYDVTMRRLQDKYKDTNYVGCASSVHQLLTSNRFYDDFKLVFGVFSYPNGFDNSRCLLDDAETAIFNSSFNNKNGRMKNIVYIPFDRSIDLDKLNKNFMLVNTGKEDGTTSDLYLATYDIESNI